MLVIFKHSMGTQKEITRFYDKQSAPIPGDTVKLSWSKDGVPMKFEGKVQYRTMDYDHSLDPETAIIYVV